MKTHGISYVFVPSKLHVVFVKLLLCVYYSATSYTESHDKFELRAVDLRGYPNEFQ